MSKYTPTTEQVREHYGESCSWHHPGRDQREMEWDAAKERFNRWLTEVKAEAWDAGHDAGWNEREDFANNGAIPSGIHQSEAVNPYRTEPEAT